MDSRDRKRLRRARRRRAEVIAYTVEIIAGVCMMGVLIGFLLWHNSFTEILLSDYVTLKLDGYDHYGTATPIVNGDSEYAEFWSTVTASVNQGINISNGDELTVTFKYDEEVARSNKLRIDDSEAKVVIEGLAESTIVDDELIFSGLTVTENGLSPKVSITVENTSEDSLISGVVYSVEGDRRFFSDGDVVQIKAELPESAFDSHEYISDREPGEAYIYEYPVVSEDCYIMNAADISAELLKNMEQIGADLIYAADANEYGLRIFQQEAHIQPVFKGNKTTFKWVNPYMISAYFHSVTPEGLEQIENHANDVQIVYGVTITQDDGKSCLAEIVVQFTNIIRHADGSVELTPEMGRIVSATYRDKNVKKLVSVDSNENYDTVKLTS